MRQQPTVRHTFMQDIVKPEALNKMTRIVKKLKIDLLKMWHAMLIKSLGS
jgi:hypothetical protein